MQICKIQSNLYCNKVLNVNIVVGVRVRVVVLNGTFNNISVVSWLSVLLVEETGVPGKSYRPVINH